MKLKASLLVLLALPLFAASGASPVLDAYTTVSAALAADDLDAAQKGAKELSATAKSEYPELAEKAGAVASAASLEEARAKFKPLSADAEKLAAGQEGYVIMHCPMAKADWVQKDRKVANPYFGKEMAGCGGEKKR